MCPFPGEAPQSHLALEAEDGDGQTDQGRDPEAQQHRLGVVVTAKLPGKPRWDRPHRDGKGGFRQAGAWQGKRESYGHKQRWNCQYPTFVLKKGGQKKAWMGFPAVLKDGGKAGGSIWASQSSGAADGLQAHQSHGPWTDREWGGS